MAEHIKKQVCRTIKDGFDKNGRKDKQLSKKKTVKDVHMHEFLIPNKCAPSRYAFQSMRYSNVVDRERHLV